MNHLTHYTLSNDVATYCMMQAGKSSINNGAGHFLIIPGIFFARWSVKIMCWPDLILIMILLLAESHPATDDFYFFISPSNGDKLWSESASVHPRRLAASCLFLWSLSFTQKPHRRVHIDSQLIMNIHIICISDSTSLLASLCCPSALLDFFFCFFNTQTVNLSTWWQFASCPLNTGLIVFSLPRGALASPRCFNCLHVTAIKSKHPSKSLNKMLEISHCELAATLYDAEHCGSAHSFQTW